MHGSLMRAAVTLIASVLVSSGLVAGALPGLAGAAWQPTDGPNGATVVAIEVDAANNDVYLATQSSVYRSTDHGATWIDIGTPAGIANVLSLHAQPGGTVLVGVSLRGVWWSTNAGATWGQDQITNDPHTGFGASISGVGIAPNGTWLAGKYRSAPGGANWIEMSIYGYDFVSTSQGVALAGTVDGVYASANGGVSWVASNAGLEGQPVQALAIDAADRVFAATFDAGVFRSLDGGQTWTPASTGLGSLSVGGIDVGNGRLYAATSDAGVFVSTDHASTWTPVQGSVPDPQTTAVAINTLDDVFVGAAAGGVALSGDQGATWEPRNAGLHARSLVSQLFAENAQVIASFGGGTHRSTDGGASWQPALSGLDDRSTGALVATANGDILVGTWFGLYRSSDSGQSWAPAGLDTERVVDLARGADGRLYAVAATPTVTPTHLFRSDDDGETWSGLLDHTDLSLPANLKTVAIDGNVIYVGGWAFDAVVVVSTDGGATWTESPVGTFGGTVVDLAIVGSGDGGVVGGGDGAGDLGGVADVYALTGNDLFFSADHGDTWSALPVGWSGSGLTLASVEADLFVGTVAEGVLMSPDAGSTWTPLNDGFPSPVPAAVSISYDGVHLFCGTQNSGLFRRPLETTDVGPEAVAPIRVLPPHPNPFRGHAHVDFESAAGVVTVDVFTAAGRFVRHLSTEVRGSGSRRVSWDGRDDSGREVANGVYWFRIATPEATVSRAVTVLR